MATKNKTKKTTKPAKMPNLTDKLDGVVELLETLSSNIFDGNISINDITDELEEITVEVENIREYLWCLNTNP
mgnify:FL=1